MQTATRSSEKSATGAGQRRPRTRGLNPLAALAYVRNNGNEDTMRLVLQKLPEKDLKYLGGGRKLTSKTWVPFKLQGRLLEAIDQVMGTGDHAVLFDVGSFMAQRDIPKVFRPLLRFGNPGWIIAVSTRMWRTQPAVTSCGVWLIVPSTKSGSPRISSAVTRSRKMES